MLSSPEQARYNKQIILPEVGTTGQEQLAAAKVLVIGAGGLGCPVLQYLTAAGVGTIGIADKDTVSLSNLQRQVLYTEYEVGELKVMIAESKLKALNPFTNINTYAVFIDNSNALDIIRNYDIVVDGSDNFETRYLVNDACVILDKPLVSGAIYKFEGQVSVLNYKGGPTYRCIFPEAPAEGQSPNCADIGVIATLPGIVGSIMANEAIKMITGIGSVMSGKLLVIDTLTMNFSTFNFKLNEANKQITQLKSDQEHIEYLPVEVIEYDELQYFLRRGSHIQLIDVREAEEHEIYNIGGTNIPLSKFDTGYMALSPDDIIILYCASGVRSYTAAKQLLRNGFKQVFNLKDGLNALSIDGV